jgi:hypothetical protein
MPEIKANSALCFHVAVRPSAERVIFGSIYMEQKDSVKVIKARMICIFTE